MSFNSILLVTIFIFSCSCGVKSNPTPPLGSQIPSYINNFLPDDDDIKKETANKKQDLTF